MPRVVDYSGGGDASPEICLGQRLHLGYSPIQVTSGAHICTNEMGCKTGYPLEFCSFNGDHTAYPDSGQESNSWGPAEVWMFLSQF